MILASLRAHRKGIDRGIGHGAPMSVQNGWVGGFGHLSLRLTTHATSTTTTTSSKIIDPPP